MFQILSLLVLYLLACFTEQRENSQQSVCVCTQGGPGWRLNSFSRLPMWLHSRSCSNHAWKADTQELPRCFDALRGPGRLQRHWKDCPASCHLSFPARPTSCFKRIKLWWPREPVLGQIRETERSNCMEFPTGPQLARYRFRILSKHHSPDNETFFNPLPLSRARVITQDAIKQKGKLSMAKAKEIFFSFEYPILVIILLVSTYFMVEASKRSYN